MEIILKAFKLSLTFKKKKRNQFNMSKLQNNKVEQPTLTLENMRATSQCIQIRNTR